MAGGAFLGPSRLCVSEPLLILDVMRAETLPWGWIHCPRLHSCGRGDVATCRSAHLVVGSDPARVSSISRDRVIWGWCGPVSRGLPHETRRFSIASLTSGTQPKTSTINFPMGDIRANGVTVPLASGGLDAMYWSAKTTDTVNVIFDVTGYFS